MPLSLPRVGDGPSYPRGRRPFSGPILRRICLFVSVENTTDILEMGTVCRFWYFHCNYAPHWTYFRLQDYRKRSKRDWRQLPKRLRASLAQPQVVTRENYVAERKELRRWRESFLVKSCLFDIRSCLALGMVVGLWMVMNYGAASLLGHVRTDVLSTDAVMGVVSFFIFVTTTILEIVVVIIPLGSFPSPVAHISSTNPHPHDQSFSKNPSGRGSRDLSWFELLLTLCLVFCPILSLSF